jgi:Ni/Fe-hydrogenase subunit HybB-like protein
MFDRAVKGNRCYWGLLAIWAILVLAGFIAYLRQLDQGLGITGMGRDVSWGLYIANFTFLVGVAASAVMVVIPYYLHNYSRFGAVTVFGEFLAVAAVTMSILFIFVDLGQPARVFNVIRYPSPGSVLFWDMLVLSLYLVLNLVIGWKSLEAERKGAPPPSWLKWLVLLSIPAAISIHTITAFIYAGLNARPFWMTALLAPRFLASAFASGPALLILLCLLMRRRTSITIGEEAIGKITQIVIYALAIHIFFLFVDFFTVFYAALPDHLGHFRYLLGGMEGRTTLSIFVWVSFVLSGSSFVLLLVPAARRREGILTACCAAVIISIWIEKGPGFVIPGFIPSPLGEAASYVPTFAEVLITLGVYGVGCLIATVLFKMALSVKEEQAH